MELPGLYQSDCSAARPEPKNKYQNLEKDSMRMVKRIGKIWNDANYPLNSEKSNHIRIFETTGVKVKINLKHNLHNVDGMHREVSGRDFSKYNLIPGQNIVTSLLLHTTQSYWKVL